MREAYTDFAQVYDIFMDETPYKDWADFLTRIIEKYGISKRRNDKSVINTERDANAKQSINAEQNVDDICVINIECNVNSRDENIDPVLSSERDLVLDLGCGTGTLTELLYEKGFDMIGVDSSQEMLSAALSKKEKSGSEILYLNQDMRDLDLYSTVGTVISVCDSVNYLLEEDEVADTFALVNNYLYPGGLFIFDFNTVYKYEQVIGDATIAENREDCSFIWENFYHKEAQVNEYDLTVFVREADSGLFRRFTETHFQRGYTLSQMEEFVKKAGMEILLLEDADTHKMPTAESQRIYVVARECQKAQK